MTKPKRPSVFSRPLAALTLCYFAGLMSSTIAVAADPLTLSKPFTPAGFTSPSSPTSPSSAGLKSSKRYTVKVTSGPNVYVGHPVVHNSLQTVLLRRNGRLKFFKPTKVDSLEKVSDRFEPKTARQLRVELQKEFGRKYEVSITRHYVVVHPPGAYQQWALPFEQFYVRFRQWFSARGLTLKQAEFPMVAIVLLDRNEYNRFTSRYTSFSYATDGYFSSNSNRMITYDKAGGRGRTAASASFDTMATVIHEAAHQAAHNVGIHSRYFAQPQWFKEGLATLFEAPGVNYPAANSRHQDRINFECAAAAQRFLSAHPKRGIVQQLIRDDGMFKADTRSAYGVSWAMTSYLFEKFPNQYIRFIEGLNEDPTTTSLTPDARLKTFQDAFGSPDRIEGGIRSYINDLAG